ncbi:hypothetical protein KUTeg_008994 [Tegillarca granosa]|uniref:Alpha/beta hydrolase fold-3 domain-containing protein n=1 Tax=Tegillarca granosa TaxID=220873 RepID=A0ABQ9FCP9_TEGGR|nr:hypothetical protein KUTeg_008994 [Tegillarca granosa]
MAMSLKSCSIIFAVIAVGLTYIFYTPLPDDAVEPWKHLLGRSLCRIVFGSANIAELLGYNGVNTIRSLGDGSQEITPDEDLEISDAKFNGVDVRIYKPKNIDYNNPGLVYLHGGGWTIGTIGSYDPLVKKIAKSSRFVVVSVGAGGNLAAAVTLKLSKDADPNIKPKAQVLIYPALQALDLNLPSYRRYNDDGGPFILAKPMMTKFWLYYGEGNLKLLQQFLENNQLISEIKNTKFYSYIDRKQLPEKYLTEEDKSPFSTNGNKELFDRVSKWLLDPYFAPLLATNEDLKKLPPTYILTAEYDPLRDDGFLLTSRLRSLNKEVVHSHFDGVQHAFVAFTFLESCGRAVDDITKFLDNYVLHDMDMIKMNLGL